LKTDVNPFHIHPSKRVRSKLNHQPDLISKADKMKKAIAPFLILLALLLAIPWTVNAGHGHHGHHGRTRVFIGGSYWVGPPPFWGPAPWYPRYYYGGPVYYGPPPAFVQPSVGYIQRGHEESDYWYYCDNPQGYYPYVKSCPGGWMKVVPETVPPDR
jgi:hypothetical protein